MNTQNSIWHLTHRLKQTRRLRTRIRHKKRFLIFLQFFSSVVEYYDFFTFAFIFFYLIDIFSRQATEVYGITIIALVSFLFRPLGYRMQIWLARYYSRRTIIFINGLIMTLSIITPGLIISINDSLWLTCSIIFISRVLNGISFGIKLQANVTYIKCLFPKRLHHTIANSTLGAQFGLTLSIFVTHKLLAHLTLTELAWGWRIPFFIGGLLSFILFMMRIITYSRLKTLTDRTISTPLDKLAFSGGRNLWLGLLVSSAKACLTFTLFISIPSILGWTLKLDPEYIPRIMFATTLLNTATSWGFKHYFQFPKLTTIIAALVASLILTIMLRYAIFAANYFQVSISICGLAILNGYLFIAIPEFIEHTLPAHVKLESILFISNYEYFHFNVIRRLGMFIALIFLNNSLDKTHFIDILLASIWITIIPGVFAAIYLNSCKNAMVRHSKLT